jgi:glutamate synthase (NADPH/NADH) small chain
MPPTLTPSTAKYAWSIYHRTAPDKRAANERVSDYNEIYANYDEATARMQAARCIQCPEPLCRQGCPLANRIPEWMALTAQGRFLEAAEVSRSTSNMPEICSRVCPQERLCEGACIINSKSDPLSIGAIERFINEYAFAHEAVEAVTAPPNGKRVAVVGGGPGGMACADELAKLGYSVTIFESMRIPGGLLVNGIPSFKIEKHIVDRRVQLLKKLGIQIRTGVALGRDVSLTQLREEFDAVFIGFGAQEPKLVDVPGADLTGIVAALPFLIQKNVPAAAADFAPIDVAGKRVVVLGGGDTAMECLRTSLRAGASAAVCLYRRDLANMPGSRKEYYNAVEEGAVFEFLANPTSIVDNGRGGVGAVKCVRMALGAADASGRRKPQPVPGSEFTVAADVILVAYGFDPIPFPAGSDLALIERNDWGGIVVDRDQMTNVHGVFAGGDSVRGPSLVVHAVRDGRKAAAGIDAYLRPSWN